MTDEAKEAPGTVPVASPSYPRARYAELLARTVEEVRNLSSTKGGEYAHGDDRLDNFRRHGAALGLPMEVIWAVYAGKHWDSITTYIRDLHEGHERARTESIAGRAHDLITYLILFLAMVDERENGPYPLPSAPPTPLEEAILRSKLKEPRNAPGNR